MKQSVSEVIIDTLVTAGAKRCYGIAGDTINHESPSGLAVRARDGSRLCDIGPLANETAKLDNALERFDIDLTGAELFVVEDSSLDPSCDNRVINHLAGAFPSRRRRAADRDNH